MGEVIRFPSRRRLTSRELLDALDHDLDQFLAGAIDASMVQKREEIRELSRQVRKAKIKPRFTFNPDDTPGAA